LNLDDINGVLSHFNIGHKIRKTYYLEIR